jgi:predicted RNase H-like HicB family nuclease
VEIPIIVEPHGSGWRARCRHPIDTAATGDTRHEAVQALEAVLGAALSEPVTVLPLEVTPDKPWVASAGAIPDDETTAAWLDAIAEYRRRRDADDLAELDAPPTPHRP